VSVDAPALLAAAVDVLWIALAIAIAVWVVAAIRVAARFVAARLEPRFLPRVARWSRRRAGVAPGAGPWACPVCRSVNAPTVVHCYGCGVPRPSESIELVGIEGDPSTYHPPAPVNRFDPALYRGPGAPAGDAAGEPGAPPGPEPEPEPEPEPGSPS
jgi:hypothetical protein